jgi:hypothetical protein
MSTDASGLFEAEKDDDGQLVLSEQGLKIMELWESAAVRHVEKLITEHVARIDEAIDAYLDQQLEESVEELRKLMILAVSELGGAAARDSFLRKVAALARANILSAESGAWAQGSPGASAANLDSLHPNSRPAHYEDMDEVEEGVSVFEEVAEGLNDDQVEVFKTIVEDLEYSGDTPNLRAQLTSIRNHTFANPSVARYVDAINSTVRPSWRK